MTIVFICLLISTAAGQDDMVMENMTVSDSMTMEAANSITAGPSFVITTTGKVTFKTGNRVYLRPGFIVESGGTFNAMFNETYGPVEPELTEVPLVFALEQNYPNPFNPVTTIKFQIARVEYTTLKIFNILGREVATVIAQSLSPGQYSYRFDAENLATGIYYYQLTTGDYQAVKKMILIR
jgi:hypothetical protein